MKLNTCGVLEDMQARPKQYIATIFTEVCSYDVNIIVWFMKPRAKGILMPFCLLFYPVYGCSSMSRLHKQSPENSKSNLTLPGFAQFRAFGKGGLSRREATPIPNVRFFTWFVLWLWSHFSLESARVWCIVGCKKARKYTIQVCNEWVCEWWWDRRILSTRLLLRG